MGTAAARWRDPGPLLQNVVAAVDTFVTENHYWNHMLQGSCLIAIGIVIALTVRNVRRQWSGK